jgi:hypothetical protein
MAKIYWMKKLMDWFSRHWPPKNAGKPDLVREVAATINIPFTVGGRFPLSKTLMFYCKMVP